MIQNNFPSTNVFTMSVKIQNTKLDGIQYSTVHCRWHAATCVFSLRVWVCKTKKLDTVKYNFYSDGSEKFYA